MKTNRSGLKEKKKKTDPKSESDFSHQQGGPPLCSRQKARALRSHRENVTEAVSIDLSERNKKKKRRGGQSTRVLHRRNVTSLPSPDVRLKYYNIVDPRFSAGIGRRIRRRPFGLERETEQKPNERDGNK